MQTPQPPDGVADRDGWDAVQEVDNEGENLTEFEVEFIVSLMKQLHQGRTLSQKQRILVDRIKRERVDA